MTLAIALFSLDCGPERACGPEGYCRTFDLLDSCATSGQCTLSNVDVTRFSSPTNDQEVHSSATMTGGADSEVDLSLAAAFAVHPYRHLEVQFWTAGELDTSSLVVTVDGTTPACSLDASGGKALWSCELAADSSTLRLVHKATVSEYGLSVVVTESSDSCTGRADLCVD